MIQCARILSVCLLLLISNLFLCTKVDAVTVTVNSFPSSISNLDQFQVTASISGATNATNYLRIDLYKEGTNNYFGETNNGKDWYSGSDGKNYLAVEVKDSSASATLLARLGSPSSTDYPGPGIYKLKIRRYTASGNSSSSDDQTPVDVQISLVFPTPTPVPASTPHLSATTIPTPVKTQTPLLTKTLVDKVTPTPNIEEATEILGEATTDSTPPMTVAPLEKMENVSQKKFPFAAIGLIVLGVIFIGASCYMAFRNQLR